MKILCISSGLAPESRSEQLAKLCVTTLLDKGVDTDFISLKDFRLDPFDPHTIFETSNYRELTKRVIAAEGLVLASPVYNWGFSSELKKFIEYVGSTDETRTTPLFDKTITLVCSAGLPHSYMAFTPLATSLMMDFKCIINPYTVYVHNRQWEHGVLQKEAKARVEKSMFVMTEITALLQRRTYRSEWEI